MTGPVAAAFRIGSGVRVRVPASSANLGPGFDSIGLALGVWDVCDVRVVAQPGAEVRVAGEGAGSVPTDESHLVVRTMLRAWAELGVSAPSGLLVECTNAVPHGRGMGSSATAIVSGIVAAQALTMAQSLAGEGSDGIVTGADGDCLELDLSFTNHLANLLEGHPDNASASVFGGGTLSWTEGEPAHTRTVRLRLHPDLDPVVFTPSEQLSTATARSVLPTQVRLADAAANSARAALLVHALEHDPAVLLPATREWLHQEARRPSYAASMRLVDLLRAEGHPAVISGAGPSVLVLSTRDRAPEAAALAPAGWRVLRPGIPDTGACATVLRDAGGEC
jgi:homoserine kinase